MFLLHYFPLFSIDYCIFYRLDIDYTDIECVATNDIGTMLRPCLYMIVKPGQFAIHDYSTQMVQLS
jgi:glycopeptide antibiotics resistance protein